MTQSSVKKTRILEKNTKPAIKLMVSALLIIVTKDLCVQCASKSILYSLIFELVVKHQLVFLLELIEGDFQVLGLYYSTSAIII
jgi:hypothetical protein